MKNHLIILFSLSFGSLAITAMSQGTNSIANAQNELIIRADSMMANYKFEEALNLLTKGDSLNTSILLRIGQCNFRLGASEAAIRPYERVLQMDSSNLTALNQLGQLYARDGDFEKALSCFTQLVRLDPTNSYYCKQAGSMAARLDDKMTAKFWFKKALDFNPADVEASLALGNILMETEEYESVDSIVQLALAVDPKFKPILLLSAKSAFEQQHYEPVITTINSLLKKSDTTALYARMLGVSYFHLRDYNKLVACMSFLLKNRYDAEWIYYYMGIASRGLDDLPASINWFKLAAQKSISENTKTYYSQLGQSYEEAGDYQEAIKAYRAAYNYSKEGILLYHLARNYDVYYKDKATALAYYRRYLESDDTIRLAKEYARKRMQDMGDF
jgi:tetratricopeptide (TPR) repeat protein